MRKKLAIGLLSVCVALSFAACEAQQSQASLPARDHSGDMVGAPTVERVSTRPDPREAPVPKFDGKPMWSANRENTAEENAAAHFERNGEAFGASSVEAYVRKAHDFIADPPAGVQTLKRANGDTLYYDPKANIFAVATRDGAPRTMFKPDNGAAYWEQQKEREQARAEGNRPRRDRDRDRDQG